MNSQLDKIQKLAGITYDDVLLLPGHSTFDRSEADLSVQLTPTLKLNLPVLSAPMDTVTEGEMCITLGEMGGLGIIHRSLTINAQATIVTEIKNHKVQNKKTATVDKENKLIAAAAVGAGPDLEERLKALVNAGLDVVLIDSGHAHSDYIMKGIKLINNKYPNLILIAGNIATYEGAKAMINCGADVLRVGMGPGSICTTRIISGMGVPQLTAVSEAVRATEGTNVTVIADGGIKQTGDMAKALAFGAKTVMLGSLLSGFDESPGTIVDMQGKKYKTYRGMGSTAAMQKGSAERYGQNNEEQKKKLIPEGVEGLVPYKGSLKNYLHQIKGSLQSSFYYIGGRTYDEFYNKSKFIQITSASMTESHPHEILITDPGANYTPMAC